MSALTHNRASRSKASLLSVALIFSALGWYVLGSSIGFAQGDKRAMQNDMPHNVGVFHDDERGVTCWTASTFHSTGISCLPDSQIGGAK